MIKGLLAGGVPLIVYLCTASGYAHWLDAGEFVAAASDFGISHPPGHPLASIVLGAANFLPLGSIAFRVAAICSLLMAVAVIAICRAFEHTLRASGVIDSGLVFPLSLAAAWWIAGTQAWWMQAVRPEVYALQAALLCVGIERISKMAAQGPDPDVRLLYQASLALGLALANHHFIALLVVLPSLWLVLGVWATRGWRPFAWSAAFGAAGLLTYLFLPLRAIAEPMLNLGDPRTPGRLFWVVSAAAFQKSFEAEEAAPFLDRLVEVWVTIAEDAHLGTLLVALLGGYLMLRLRSSRKFGLFWLSLLLVFTFGRAALGFVRHNPDALGYLMPAYASLGVLCAFAVGVVLSSVVEAAPSMPRLAPVLGAVVVGASLFQFSRNLETASLADFVDTDVFDDGLRRTLPEKAVVFAHNPDTIFRFWGGEAEEGTRPDVTLVPVPLVTYPKLVDRMVSVNPELAPVLRNYLLDGRLRSSDLQSLAALRPVFVEMDIRIETDTFELLVPEQLYHRILTADFTEMDESRAMQLHAGLWDDLYSRVGRPIDPQTSTQLLWRHYADALYFAGIGDSHGARRSVAAGLALNPHARELRALQEALDSVPPGERIDVAPFRVR